MLSGGLAQATELSIFKTVANTDFTTAAIGGLREVGAGSITLTNISGTVKQAYLYWQGPINSPTPGGAGYLLLNNQTVKGTDIGISGNNCWPGFQFSQGFRADVTSFITGNGTYSLSTFSPLAQEVEGASLIVFFDDGIATNNSDVLVFDGNDSSTPNGYDSDGWKFFLSGLAYTASNAVSLQMHVADAQDLYDGAIQIDGTVLRAAGPTFSGTSVPVPVTYNFTKFAGALWDVQSFDISPFLTPGPNTLLITSQQKVDCISLILAVASQKTVAGSTNPPPGTNINHAPTISGSAPITVEANIISGGTSPTLTVHVTDIDADKLIVSWQIDGGLERVDRVLPTGSNTVADLFMTHFYLAGNHIVDVTVADGTATPQTFRIAVTVIDGYPPVVTFLPAPTFKSDATGNLLLPNIGGLVGATDNLTTRSNLVITQFPSPGTPVAMGTYPVTLQITDEALNSTVVKTTITVSDGVPPVITYLPVISIMADSGGLATIPAITNLVVASDNVTPAGQLIITQSILPGKQVAASVTSMLVTVTDQNGNSTTGTVYITITPYVIPTNRRPVASNDFAATISSVPVTINVLANDSDPDGDSLSVNSNSVPAHGTAVIQSTGSISYTPNAGFIGTDSFTYSISDNHGGFATATVTITVAAPIPTINCGIGQSLLWPPNHNLVNVGFNATIRNITGPLRVDIFSNEPDVPTNGYTCSDDVRKKSWNSKDEDNDAYNKSCDTKDSDRNRSISDDARRDSHRDDDSDRNSGDREGGDDGHERSSNDDSTGNDANFSPDARDIGLNSLRLRSERLGTGPGRVYLVVITGTNAVGQVASCAATCTVPHDQSKASTDSVSAMAVAASTFYFQHGQPPVGYVKVGVGPVVGPKQ